jgi:hypothetical protein
VQASLVEISFNVPQFKLNLNYSNRIISVAIFLPFQFSAQVFCPTEKMSNGTEDLAKDWDKSVGFQ